MLMTVWPWIWQSHKQDPLLYLKCPKPNPAGEHSHCTSLVIMELNVEAVSLNMDHSESMKSLSYSKYLKESRFTWYQPTSSWNKATHSPGFLKKKDVRWVFSLNLPSPFTSSPPIILSSPILIESENHISGCPRFPENYCRFGERNWNPSEAGQEPKWTPKESREGFTQKAKGARWIHWRHHGTFLNSLFPWC